MTFFLLFLVGFLAGGFTGILLMTIFAVGKREDGKMEQMLRNI